MDPKIIVGDIHGCVGPLKVLIDAVGSHGRPIIFLGDYVNRGGYSRQVVEFLIGLETQGLDVTFLCGNHDWAFLQYIDSNCFDPFALLGGLHTLSSYISEETRDDPHELLLKVIPEEHIQFLRRLKPYYENKHLMCSHTGFSAECPQDRTFAQMVLGSHPALFKKQIAGSKLNVCGHYPQANLLPYHRGNFVCLDTGCGTLRNGKLSALFFPEMYFLQASDSGRPVRL